MKLKIEEIQNMAVEHNWRVISKEYTNLNTEMTFECPEGHTVFSSFKKIRDKWYCPICAANQYKEPSHNVIQKKMGVKRVIAFDQASYVTGYSIFDGNELIDYGTFETQLDSEVARFNMIKMWAASMINNWKPDYIGIEGIQFEKEFGVTTFQTLARLQGVLMELCYEQNIPFEICPTNTWRHHCKVKGQSRPDKKRSCQLLVKDWYDITVNNDISDAIGIGKYVSEVIVKKNDLIEW